MKNFRFRGVSFTLAVLLGVVMSIPQGAQAQDHVVSPAEMQHDVTAASAARQRNEEQVEKFLSSEEAQRALKTARISPQQVTNAISQLSDSDLAQLAARSAQAQKDFAAGNINISDHDLLIIVAIIVGVILLAALLH
jgi:hypothetical protein